MQNTSRIQTEGSFLLETDLLYCRNNIFLEGCTALIFRSKYSIGKLTKLSSKRSVGALHQARRARQKKAFSILKKLALGCLGLSFIAALILGGVIFNISRNLPDVESISTYIPAETTKIYSQDNVILAELHLEENRVLIPIEKISPLVQKAVIAMEDSNFYSHHGLDFKGILRALYQDIIAGSFVQGGKIGRAHV